MTREPENAFLDLHSPQIPKSTHKLEVTITTTDVNKLTKKKKTTLQRVGWTPTVQKSLPIMNQSKNNQNSKLLKKKKKKFCTWKSLKNYKQTICFCNWKGFPWFLKGSTSYLQHKITKRFAWYSKLMIKAQWRTVINTMIRCTPAAQALFKTVGISAMWYCLPL